MHTPTVKNAEGVRNGSIRELYERSLYERTFMSKPIENHAIYQSYLMLI